MCACLVGLEVELAVHGLALAVDQLERVAAVPVHVAVPVGSAAVGEEEGDLVRGLRAQGDKVPEHVCTCGGVNEWQENEWHVCACCRHRTRVLAVRRWVALLGVDEAGEEDGVADEEDGRVAVYGPTAGAREAQRARCLGQGPAATHLPVRSQFPSSV